MKKRLNSTLSAKHLRYGTALALVSFFAGNQAFAQDTKPAAAQEAKPGSDAALVAEETIVVIGTRASQQSAILRKKNAKTAMDSIVAEDVGAFPDRNIGEAISRIAGVALDRGDMGEGVSVTVRGNTPDLTRVEIDGQGVQSGGGASAAMNGDISQGGDGRGVGFRELPTDLIKSVDVVKGSTADMTEGALGGGIIIKTRTGLDFKKPYVAIRVAAAQGSINKAVQPDLNLIATSKFLDNRLGVLLNVSKAKVTNEGHNMQLTDNSRGYSRALDFDNSPEKTFTFNPNTVSTTDKAATTIINSVPFNAYTLNGVLTAAGTLNSETPLSLVQKSAAAATKANCYTAFPALSAPQIAAIQAGNGITQTNNRTAAVNQRNAELYTCLNQWNDYTPSNLRYGVKRDIEDRLTTNLRFDFKVNDNLTVYAMGSVTSRLVLNDTETYSLGGTLATNTAGTFTDAAGVRTANAGSGYYTYSANPSNVSGVNYVTGTVANIIPSSVVVDSTHHVTSYSYSGGGANTDQIQTTYDSKSKYFQVGGTYKKGGLITEFFVGDAKNTFTRNDLRASWATTYGDGALHVTPNGLWSYTFPAASTFDQTNAALYSGLTPGAAVAALTATIDRPATPAYTAAQRAQYTQFPQLSAIAVRLNQTEEKTAKVDVTYNIQDKLPFITQIKGGFNLRDNGNEGWGNGGATISPAIGTFGTPGYVAPVILPNNNLRGNFVGCENTPGSLGAGGQPCAYGYVPFTALAGARAGTTTFTQAQFQNIIAQSMKPASAVFFNGVPDRGDLIQDWNQIDIKKLWSLVGVPNYNFDCIKSCTASDGKVYDQPVVRVSEKTKAGYLMADFEKSGLPFGMEFTANIGARVAQTVVTGSGAVTFTSITKTAAFDPLNQNAAAGIQTVSVTRQTSIDRTTTDLMPAYNYALWVIPSKVVLRYSYGKTVARPNVQRLLPAGTCTFDERRIGAIDADGSDQDMSCSTMGNPALKAQNNSNQNLSIEWYPNKDYMFSLAAFRQISKVGGPITQTVSNQKFFTGSDAVDPQTGKSLADLEFAFNTYVNGPGTNRKGIEFASKSAFTFLPWAFKYTGLDINFSRLNSSDSVSSVDFNSGKSLPPAGEAHYAGNISLWYDDGSLQARVAYQARAATFSNISGASGTALFDYPAQGVGTSRVPYNTGAPNFRDATHYVDAKVSYKFKSGIELFAEGRNLGLQTISGSAGAYGSFADGTPMLNDYGYAGRRVMVGLNYRH